MSPSTSGGLSWLELLIHSDSTYMFKRQAGIAIRIRPVSQGCSFDDLQGWWRPTICEATAQRVKFKPLSLVQQVFSQDPGASSYDSSKDENDER